MSRTKLADGTGFPPIFRNPEDFRQFGPTREPGWEEAAPEDLTEDHGYVSFYKLQNLVQAQAFEAGIRESPHFDDGVMNTLLLRTPFAHFVLVTNASGGEEVEYIEITL